MFASSFSSILFTILKIICWAIDRLTQLFEIFCGLTKVSYKGEPTFLFSVFLNHSAINNIYWGMALIGLALCFAFTIAAVVRKMFDINGRQQMSMGQILTEALKSFFIIIGMNLILSAALTGTDVLLRQINYLFVNAEGLNRTAVVEFTDDQYAAMGRALSSIANYGMNPSYNSRYNMNDCFNTIRPDLVYLEEQGVFDYAYPTDEGNSWQSILQEVANSADLRYELKGDVYYESVTKALEHALTVMRSDASFRPLERFEEQRFANAADVPLDRIVFLVGTLNAANNNFFNRNPSFSDALRLPYYTGEKSLYDAVGYDSVKAISGDFDISYSRFDYFVSFVLGISVLYNTFTILLALVARMFNILFLYIIAPPVLAVRPLDGGGKTKQWVNAFIIQLLGVFGSIIVMRLLLIFVPLIYEPELVLISGNSSLNYFAKAVMLIAAYAVAKKGGALLSGILSDTAAMQSMQAGDMSSTAQRAIGTARRVAGTAVRTAGAAVGFAASPLTNAIKKPFDAYRRLGSGASNSDIRRQAKERLAVEKMVNQLRSESDQGSGGSDKDKGGPGEGNLPPKGGNGDLTKKQDDVKNKQADQQGQGTDFSRLKNALKIGDEGSSRKRSPSVSRPQQNVPNLDRESGGQPKAGEVLQRDRSNQEQPSDLPKQGSGTVNQGGSASLEQKQGSYSPEPDSMRDSGQWENASWMDDFQNMSYRDEEQDSFEVPSFLGGERSSDFGESLQNDPLGNLKEEMLSETLSELGVDIPGAEGSVEGRDGNESRQSFRSAGGSMPPPPPPPPRQTGNSASGTPNQTRNANGSGTGRRQSGNTQLPRQTGNSASGTPNQTQNMNGSGTERRQSGNTQPPRQTGNSVPGTQTQVRSTSGSEPIRENRNPEPQQTAYTEQDIASQTWNIGGSDLPRQEERNPEPRQTAYTEQDIASQTWNIGGSDLPRQENRNPEPRQETVDAEQGTPDQAWSIGGSEQQRTWNTDAEPPRQAENRAPNTVNRSRNTVSGEQARQTGGYTVNEPPRQAENRAPNTVNRPRNTVSGERPRQTGGYTVNEPRRQAENRAPNTTDRPTNTVSGERPRQTGGYRVNEPQRRTVTPVPNTWTEPHSTSPGEPPRQGSGVNETRQTVVPTGQRRRSASAGGISVTDYMRRTYRELNRDTDEQNTGT